MVRYTPDDFLTEYSKFLAKVNKSKTGSVELNFKRYDANNDDNLPPTNDKTGIKRPIKSKTTKSKINKGAANPEATKYTRNKQKVQLQKTIIKGPDTETSSSDNKATLKSASVLIRAKFGTKKVSCVVPSLQVVDFSDQFATLFRLHNKNLVPQGQDSARTKARKAAAEKGKK